MKHLPPILLILTGLAITIAVITSDISDSKAEATLTVASAAVAGGAGLSQQGDRYR